MSEDDILNKNNCRAHNFLRDDGIPQNLQDEEIQPAVRTKQGRRRHGQGEGDLDSLGEADVSEMLGKGGVPNRKAHL